MRAQRKKSTLKTIKINVAKPTEAAISKAFLRTIKQLQSVNYFSKELFIFHIPNERKSHPLVKINLKFMGVVAGIADYCILVKGGKWPCAFLEFKRDKNCKLSLAQQGFSTLCADFGIPFKKVYTVNDGIEYIKELTS